MNDAGWLEPILTCAGFVAASTAFLLLAWGITRLLVRRSAATRHLVWSVAFAAALLTPVAGLLLPARPVPVVRIAAEAVATEPLALELSASELSAVIPSVDLAEKVPEPPKSPMPVVAGLWIFGMTLAGAEALVALFALYMLRRRGSAPGVDLAALTQRAGLERNWELRVAAGPYPPTAMTWGIRRPVVMLPEAALAWPQERLEAVVLHELAHVRRWDCASQLVAVTTCALYWFNPVVWLCARAMRAEAELAADDAVLRSGVTPSVYAEALLGIAAALGKRRQPFATVGVPIMKRSKIERRIESILDPRARRRGATLAETLVVASFGLVALIPLATLRPAVAQEPPTALIAPTAAVAVRPVKAAIAPQATPRLAKARKPKRTSAKRHSHRVGSKPVDVYIVSASPKLAPAAPRAAVNVQAVRAPRAVTIVSSAQGKSLNIVSSARPVTTSVASTYVTQASPSLSVSHVSEPAVANVSLSPSSVNTSITLSTPVTVSARVANSVSLVRAQGDVRATTTRGQVTLVQANRVQADLVRADQVRTARAKQAAEAAAVASADLRAQSADTFKAVIDRKAAIQQLRLTKTQRLSQKIAAEQADLVRFQGDAVHLQRVAVEQQKTLARLKAVRLNKASARSEVEIAETRLAIARAQLKLAKQLAALHRKDRR